MAWLVKALLCIPHRKAVGEMGFNKNCRHLNERAQCAIQTVHGIRHIVSFFKRFDGDASHFNVTPEVLRAVQTSSKDCQERIAAEKLRQLSSGVLTQPRLVLVMMPETGSSKKWRPQK